MSNSKIQVAAALEKSSVARYIQLASLFRGRIVSGEWAVGARIPTVEQLAKECGVAGMTIRQAFDLLQKEGLVERFRAKGTFVKQAPPSDLWCEVETDWNGLLMSRDGADISVLDEQKDVALPALGTGLIGQAADSYRHLTRLHRRSGEPFLYADVFIEETVAALVDPQNFFEVTAMRLLSDLDQVQITDAKQILTIGTADLELSDRLNLAIGAPIVNVLRLAVDQHGTLVLAARGAYRGDRVRIDMKLMQ